MEHLFFYCFMIFLFSVFVYFRLKILVFLFLECMMLMIVCMWFISFNSFPCFFCVMLFSVFMVLDSVLGLSILIGGSRYSCKFGSVVNFV